MTAKYGFSVSPAFVDVPFAIGHTSSLQNLQKHLIYSGMLYRRKISNIFKKFWSGTMNHELFEDWFENHLLPELPKETVIVMNNASFHRKEQLYCLAQKYECYLIFLPPYSPDLNPIERFWAWLKRTLRKILPKLDSLDLAIFAAFYFRDKLSSV